MATGNEDSQAQVGIWSLRLPIRHCKLPMASRGPGLGTNRPDIQILGFNSCAPIRRRVVLSPQ
jgi:hypothetical protein